ncbi:glycosyltransferase family protein [Paenibacillus cymbidii]|uniref:hypothetical protein n=1 Tax=Paenibacillus cymbidii TaxID=1639034 RepID=UPI001081DA46|nr:hypothetical protein [Paenibacillus cymbidii]
MNIGLFSSYGMKCGIAEYSLELGRALNRIGHYVTIFGNRRDTVRPDRTFCLADIDPRDTIEYVPCFNAGAWCRDSAFDFPLLFRELEARRIEAVIVQYQNGIFHDTELRRLLAHCSDRRIEVLVTLHDSCIGPDFPFEWIRHFVSHANISDRCHRLPFGVPKRVEEDKEALKQRYQLAGPLIATLGLGRTDYSLISRVAGDIGYRFMAIDPANSCRVDGEHLIRVTQWLTTDELTSRLAASDAIVLWYPDTDATVHSSAICVALASSRPVIVNDVSWFKDIPGDVVIKVRNEEELRSVLSDASRLRDNAKQADYVRDNQWEHIASRYAAILTSA